MDEALADGSILTLTAFLQCDVDLWKDLEIAVLRSKHTNHAADSQLVPSILQYSIGAPPSERRSLGQCHYLRRRQIRTEHSMAPLVLHRSFFGRL
ncbi:hypothetical protein C7412_11845 [Paraburkholderia silvatlantica]|nr:hypothetical protein C7412_11845 [Paraburkholderia silvatlantica]